MSLVENTATALNEQGVTTINAQARIDYILRFSKHTILVIDDNPDVYTDVANEFLGGLSTDHNAAFISISSKLNDIQIRCRIIEQLFGNTLFDPEQPLSVNVVKLSEAKNESITIVIANAESLSLQLTHELCQLAEIAKKLDKTINVLLLGKIQAAINLVENKHLFTNKVSILLAESGQLVSFNSALLKKKSSFLTNKFFLVFISLTIILIIVALTLGKNIFFENNNPPQRSSTIETYKKDFVEVKLGNSNEDLIDTTKIDLKTVAIKSTNSNEISSKKIEATNTNQTKITPASSTEIFNLLTSSIEGNKFDKNLNRSTTSIIKPAINSAPLITINDQTKNTQTNIPAPTSPNKEIVNSFSNKINQSTTSKLNELESNDNDYYQQKTTGYVIQLASFEKLKGYDLFIDEYKNIELYGYKRRTNGNLSYIVTSAFYQNKNEAKVALTKLPKALRDRGAWIKSIQAVNNEIKLYLQSR